MNILKEAGGTMEQNNYSTTIALIYQALTTYIAYKCGKTPQEITIKNARNLLEGCFSINAGVKKDILNLIEQCTLLKFSAWDTDYRQKVNDLHEKVMSAINSMESSRPNVDNPHS